MSETDNKIYEAGYLLAPELAEDAVAGEVGAIKSLILDKLGGTEIGSEMPRMIDLSYGIDKRIGSKIETYTKAHFGWVKFELTAEKIKELEEALKKNNRIIRFLVIKTVRENTMSQRKPVMRAPDMVRKKTEGESTAPMTEEEMDKTIEELVIE